MGHNSEQRCGSPESPAYSELRAADAAELCTAQAVSELAHTPWPTVGGLRPTRATCSSGLSRACDDQGLTLPGAGLASSLLALSWSMAPWLT